MMKDMNGKKVIVGDLIVCQSEYLTPQILLGEIKSIDGDELTVCEQDSIIFYYGFVKCNKEILLKQKLGIDIMEDMIKLLGSHRRDINE